MLNVSRSDYHFISLCLPIDVDIQFGFIWHVGYLSKLQKQFYIFLFCRQNPNQSVVGFAAILVVLIAVVGFVLNGSAF